MKKLHILLLVYTGLSVPNILYSQFVEEAKSVGLFNFSDEFLSGGVAFLDYNNDGFEDIYVSGGGRGDVFYKNTGEGNFIDVTSEVGLDRVPNVVIMGILSADFDNDGFVDILLTTESGFRSFLFWNVEGKAFEETGFDSGTDILLKFYGSSAAAADFDKDGDLDIYQCNYDVDGIDILLENNGDRTFTNITEIIEADLSGRALAVSISDYDNDSDLDILVGNDFGFEITPNKLLRNQYPEKKFIDESNVSNWNVGINSMGIATGDYDNDMDLDYYVTDIGGNHFFRNRNDEPSFIEETNIAPVLQETTSWGTEMYDINNNGNLELLVANGPLFLSEEDLEQENSLYFFEDNQFFNKAVDYGFDSPLICRGLAIGDYNDDRLPDILIGVVGESDAFDKGPLLYRNNSFGNKSIKIELQGNSSSRDSYGAKINYTVNGESYYRELTAGGSYLSTDTKNIILGLESANICENLEIIWPSGNIDNYSDLSANVTYRIVEETGIFSIENKIGHICEGESFLVGNREVFEEGLYLDTLNDTSIPKIVRQTVRYKNDCVISSIKEEITQMTIYPNPFKNRLNISSRNKIDVLEVYDNQGRVIFSEKNINSYRTILNLSILKAGLYRLKMKTGKGETTRNIFKIK